MFFWYTGSPSSSWIKGRQSGCYYFILSVILLCYLLLLNLVTLFTISFVSVTLFRLLFVFICRKFGLYNRNVTDYRILLASSTGIKLAKG